MAVFNEEKKKKTVKSQIEICKNKDKLGRRLTCVFKILVFTPSISNIKGPTSYKIHTTNVVL